MLNKLWSQAFQHGATAQTALRFHSGLNVIEGGERAKNSIGKSTLLSIIDFVYGGSDFCNSDVVQLERAVGHHTIFFSLKLNNTEHYFSRNTERAGYITIYSDDSWSEEVQEISLSQYHHFLRRSYGLEHSGATWREIVGRFSRLNEEVLGTLDYPLASVPREGDVVGAKAMLCLFGVLDETVQLQQDLSRIATELRTLNAMAKGRYSSYISITSNKQRKAAQSNLEHLQAEAKKLRYGSDLDLFEAEIAAQKEQQSAKALLRPLVDKLRALEGRLANVEQVLSGETRITSRDLNAFYEFFPQANKERLETVEYYHHELSRILHSQLEEQRALYQNQIARLKREIQDQQAHILQLDESVTLDEETYSRLFEVHRQILEVTEQIRAYDQKCELKSREKTLREEAKTSLPKILDSIEVSFNNEMAKVSQMLDSDTERKIPPRFSFHLGKTGISYEFDHCGDAGSGAKSRHLTIFDISMLKLTPLPFLIHDSAVVKLVEHEPIHGLMEAYMSASAAFSGAQEPKQVFFSLDATKIYGTQAEHLTEKTRVLRLSTGEGALYGHAWNLLKEEETQL